MSSEIASAAAGAVIITASSYDFSHPPENVVDGDSKTFWFTTGCFPQELVLQLGAASNIKSVEMTTTGVQHIELLKSDGPNANSWESIVDNEINDSEGEFQRIAFKIPPRTMAMFLKGKVSSLSFHKIKNYLIF